jgi:hypothetical protein
VGIDGIKSLFDGINSGREMTGSDKPYTAAFN